MRDYTKETWQVEPCGPTFVEGFGTEINALVAVPEGSMVAFCVNPDDARVIAASPALVNAARDMLVARAKGYDLPWGTLAQALALATGEIVTGSGETRS